MKLSVVILNYNVRYFLEQCIRSAQIAIEDLDAEIIVIDNNSPDDSCEMVTQFFPKITLIQNKDNVGFSKANNQAVQIAKGEYLCILNPDTAVAKNTFTDSLRYADQLSNLGILGVFLMDGTGSFLPESKRNVPTPKASLLKLLGIGRDYYASHIQNEGTGKVEVLVGAYMLVKRNIYDQVKGFDEDYFMYGEDIDLSYKVTQAGYENQYLGTVNVLHYKGESTKKDAAYLDRFYGAMNIFYKKHFRTNFLFNGLVSVGLFIAKRGKKKAIESEKGLQSENRKTLFISENTELQAKLERAMDTTLNLISLSALSEENIEKTCFVFDADYIPYEKIFKIMKDLKGKGNSFRIRPPQSNFILGSDQSDQKGTVLVFS